MFNGENGYSLSDIAAASGNRNNGGAFGDNSGAWWIIILFLFCFAGGWGNGRNGLFGGSCSTGSGITDGYILTSDFASLERQIGNGFDMATQQGQRISDGISSLGYDQLNQMNGINQNINAAANNINTGITALGTQLASCCCDLRNGMTQNFADVNYRLAEQSCQTRQTINNVGRDITDNANANTRSILGALQNMQTQALQDKIAELTAMNSDLRFQASQAAQNAYLVNALSPAPIPAYAVPNPYAGAYGYNRCGCNCSAAV